MLDPRYSCPGWTPPLERPCIAVRSEVQETETKEAYEALLAADASSDPIPQCSGVHVCPEIRSVFAKPKASWGLKAFFSHHKTST